MGRSLTDTTGWREKARQLHRKGETVAAIARQINLSAQAVRGAIDPEHNERRAEMRRARLRHEREIAVKPALTDTPRSIVKEQPDGTQISLPRVTWLERPMPGARS